MHQHVSLLTDYGLDDEFVGVVKSVIVDLAPHVNITDITHGIAPFDVRAGSLALARAVQYVPAGIVLAIVDPGVGSSRRAVAVEVAGGRGILLGPDNGLLAPAVAMAGGAERAFELSNTSLHLDAPGTTFAGRDIFAPVAAHLCNGVAVEEVGDEIDPALVMPAVVPLASDESHAAHGAGLRCEVTWVDRFGNCQLNVGRDETRHLGDVIKIVLPGGGSSDDVVRVARVTDHYGGIGEGSLGLVVDSYGMLSVCLDRASAAEMLGTGEGDAVLLFAGEMPVGTASVEIRPAR
ncbi:MAG: hypothetical protein RLY50_384 [Actinomycetota bacterium]